MRYPRLHIGALQGRRAIIGILVPMLKLRRSCGQQKCQPLRRFLGTMDHGPTLGLPLVRDTPLCLPWVARAMAFGCQLFDVTQEKPHFLGHSPIPREQLHELRHHPLTAQSGALFLTTYAVVVELTLFPLNEFPFGDPSFSSRYLTSDGLTLVHPMCSNKCN